MRGKGDGEIPIATKIRKIVYRKYFGRCAYCGHPITQKGMHVDHIHPRRRGGKDNIENLNPACQPCNNYKMTFSIEGLRREIGRQVERGRRYSVNFRLAERYGLIKVTNNPIVFYFETALRRRSTCIQKI